MTMTEREEGGGNAAGAAAPPRELVPASHPRAESLRIRHRLVEGYRDGLVAAEGLMAHGRGEAFDYLLGETTGDAARRACRAAAAAMRRAERPVISVNGNAAALCAGQLVRLAELTGAALEVNLFYDGGGGGGGGKKSGRKDAIAERLRACGAKSGVLGVRPDKLAVLNGTDSARRMVDVDGILSADLVVVPLEDGDRTGALKRAGKGVVAFDLNPLSRTAQTADISIVDNIARAIDVLADEYLKLSERGTEELDKIVSEFDNAGNLRRSTRQINANLAGRAGDLVAGQAAYAAGSESGTDAASASAAATATEVPPTPARAQKEGESGRLTIRDITVMKKAQERITVVTSYDYTLASLCDRTGTVDILLVGDSAGMVMLGYDNTAHVTMDEMCMFTGAVSRARKRSVIVADMPFMSYQADTADAVRNAGRLIRAGADAVKLEGGAEIAPRVRGIVGAGIPVMGHIGLQPQTAALSEGYRVQGRTAAEAAGLLGDAGALEEAGVFAIVLEMVAHEAAGVVTRRSTVPTIGIGSGAECDGQVLVVHDMLGMYDVIRPKFAKRYCNLADEIAGAVSSYADDVARGRFPARENRFAMSGGEYARLLGEVGRDAGPAGAADYETRKQQ